MLKERDVDGVQDSQGGTCWKSDGDRIGTVVVDMVSVDDELQTHCPSFT